MRRSAPASALAILALAAPPLLLLFPGGAAGEEALPIDAEDECLAGNASSPDACGLSLRQLRAKQQQQTYLKSGGSCQSYGCGGFNRANDCQCTPECGTYGNCCVDYQATCLAAAAYRGGGQPAAAPVVYGGPSNNIMLLYHQTSVDAGHSIMKEGFRKPSIATAQQHHSLCGPAIYFSPSPRDTEVKAVGGRGYMIEATVDMGRMMQMNPNCDTEMTGEKLARLGYDSLTLDRGFIFECFWIPSCREFIIYDPNRIVSLKGHPSTNWGQYSAEGEMSWVNPNYIGRKAGAPAQGAPPAQAPQPPAGGQAAPAAPAQPEAPAAAQQPQAAPAPR